MIEQFDYVIFWPCQTDEDYIKGIGIRASVVSIRPDGTADLILIGLDIVRHKRKAVKPYGLALDYDQYYAEIPKEIEKKTTKKTKDEKTDKL